MAGIPNDGARDVPDVALTAAGHDAYLLCIDGSCTPNSTGEITFQGYSGTSAATPSFAGIIALVKQKTGSRLGQANYTLYSLAAQETLSSCDASNTSTLPASTCVFNDVTSGNNAVPGEPGYGTSTAQYQAGVGYDLTTGLGSVNVTNLAYAWTGGAPPQSQAVNGLTGINQPSAQNATLTGLTTFSGWALTPSTTISLVNIAVDGYFVGYANYGLSRPDICANYPNSPGCPNVGWSYLFDTTTIADGAHTLEVRAVSSTGQNFTVSTTFTVANWTTADPMMISIDNPSASSGSFSGTVSFGGWAIDNLAAISQVAIAIDGVSFGTAAYGGARADVCSIYPGRSGCPNVGWNFGLDTTLLADGTHTLTVTPTTAGGQSSTASVTFQIDNSANNPIVINMDAPGAVGTTFSGSVIFAGWAIDANSTISNVAISIDGAAYGNAVYGTGRPDVCAIYPNTPGCPNVGWIFGLDTTKLLNGTHTVAVTAFGSTHATASKQFTVANSTAVTVAIDSPGSQNNIVQGVAAFSGWAISNDSVVTSVSVFVDGVPKGVGNYGLPRPDVCTVYPGRPGCPNVGWRLFFDTSLVADGQHMLMVSATVTDSNGAVTEQGSNTSTFTVANWTTGNPIRINIDSPNANSGAFQGVVGFGGWAIDDIAAMSSVAVAVDGTPYGLANYGGARSDVCSIYPGRAGCPNVGWNFGLDTTLLTDGTHTLQVTGTSSGGQSWTTTQTFQVSNSSSDPVALNIDSPGPGQALSGTAGLDGWAINMNGVPIQSVQVLVDGTLYGMATYGNSRPDVCQAFPSAGGCPNVGWTYLLDTTAFANGSHTLQIRAIAVDGSQYTGGQSFDVNNAQ